MYKVGRELQCSPVVERVRTITGNIKRDVPSHHGVVHDLSVVRFGTYLALVEGVNIRNVQIAAFLHDIRWWDDKEKRIRKIAPQEEGQSFPSATDLLAKLKKRKRIDGQSHDLIESEQSATHRELDKLLNQKRAQDFRKELFTLEDPELLSQQSFAYFIGIS